MTHCRPFGKVLIANRGEIARRVLRAVRAAGLSSVAVYSDADADAMHLREADTAIRVGPAPALESYLSIDAVLDAARISGADAIHPGYGFLSENPDFARACTRAGLVFIGPRAETIELMASKRRAKEAMLAAGVPCIPGWQGDESDLAALGRLGEEVGFPLMIKASAGGGGRGIRLASTAAALPAQLALARTEAVQAFGDGTLILERALHSVRHIEIQVLADAHGQLIHLGERDCSLQRRHQKIVEECPSPAVDEGLRERMGETALAAARACSYVGAGTVELLLEDTGEFYFLEMNTRIQVEHPVTEAVTGIDLVDWQLRIAAGERLAIAQQEPRMDGHAIEARLYAEDPERGFLPQTGRVLRWRPAGGDGVRIDHAVEQGLEVGSHYDPMLAKVIAWGRDRQQARRRLRRALQDTVLLGVTTNKDFLCRTLDEPAFARGAVTTDLLDRCPPSPATADLLEDAAIAAIALTELTRTLTEAYSAQFMWWCNTRPGTCRFRLVHASGEIELELTPCPGSAGRGLSVACDGDERRIEVLAWNPEQIVYVASGRRKTVSVGTADNEVFLDFGDRTRHFEDVTYAPVQCAHRSGDGRVIAGISGSVSSVLVSAGQRIARGQDVAMVEAMKMLHHVSSNVSGTVTEIRVAPGDQVAQGQLLAMVCCDAQRGQA